MRATKADWKYKETSCWSNGGGEGVEAKCFWFRKHGPVLLQGYEFVNIPASGSMPRSITASPGVWTYLCPMLSALQADPAQKDPGR